MTDPAIIEAAARALYADEDNVVSWDNLSQSTKRSYRIIALGYLTKLTPIIEAAALERAAKVAEEWERRERDNDGEHVYIEACRDIAYDIRALKEQP